MKKIAIILSGCGNRDGSELQESLSLMLSIDRRGWQYQCFAPEGFFEVVPHVDVEETEEEGTLLDMEQRDIFVESARIARGNLLPLEDYRPEDFDGPRMEVIDGVTDAILETYRAKKPVVAMCIAPMVLAKVLGRYEVELTLGPADGSAPNTPAGVAKGFGCRVTPCGPSDICVDSEHKVITTPAYMAATRISEIFDGAANMVDALAKMLG